MIVMQKPVWHDRSIHARALWLYRKELLLFLAVLAPAVVSAYLIHFGSNYAWHEIRMAMENARWRGPMPLEEIRGLGRESNAEIAIGLGIRWLEAFLTFTICGLAYATVASSVRRYQFGSELSARLAFADVCPNIKQAFQVTALLFLLCSFVRIVSGTIVSFFFFVLRGHAIWITGILGWIILAGAIGALVRWAYAIPQAALYGSSAFKALRESASMIEGHHNQIWWLMVESAFIAVFADVLPWILWWTQLQSLPYLREQMVAASGYLLTGLLLPIPMIGAALLYADELERRHPELAAAATVE